MPFLWYTRIMYIDDVAIQKFSTKVKKLVENGNCTFVEAILEISEQMGLDPEAGGKLIDASIKEKVEQEFLDLKMMKKKIKKTRIVKD